MKNSGKKKYTLLAALSLGVFALLAALLAFSLHTRRAEREETAELSTLYSASAETADSHSAAATDADSSSVVPDSDSAGDIPSRFSDLYARNPELIGWLRAGDAVDEPVVFRDNSFYLSHGFDGQQSHSGTVFADERNATWYSDKYVILYGHNIRGGDRFARLSRYKDSEYVSQNPVIEWDTVRSGDAPWQYAVFAAFDASMLPDDDNYFHLRRFDELREGGANAAQALIDEVKARSCIDVPLDVTPEDDLLVLVTCSYSDSDGRLMVFTRALRDGETADDIPRAVSESSDN